MYVSVSREAGECHKQAEKCGCRIALGKPREESSVAASPFGSGAGAAPTRAGSGYREPLKVSRDPPARPAVAAGARVILQR
jgi:hypothetical protein